MKASEHEQRWGGVTGTVLLRCTIETRKQLILGPLDGHSLLRTLWVTLGPSPAWAHARTTARVARMTYLRDMASEVGSGRPRGEGRSVGIGQLGLAAWDKNTAGI